MFLANTAQMVGLRTTTASRAAFLVQLESVLVPLASAALGLTPLTATALVSSAVTVAGVATAGQRVVPASEAAIIYATQPLWASLLAAVVLGESFEGRGVLGGLLILVGVVLAGRGRRPSVVAVEPGEDAGGGAATASTAPTLAP
ncbi:hypothetical protein I4F81_004759 [Pyropia yezoensis]|uniref:Uncharacterized protein n=1 Tax=Pyropia yezoensis TaxID=2788 RepID=A0ACC3BW80_PYRYE|nr:hypothetical protein I4F81_004759 [Neopyropia yezoensis]